MLKDILARLDDLYTRTEMDWHIEIDYCLTEPTCPTVVINPEGLAAARYRVDCSSIEEGVAEAVERVHREIIQGQVITPMAPYSNPDDAKLSRWIEKWHRGEKLTEADYE